MSLKYEIAPNLKQLASAWATEISIFYTNTLADIDHDLFTEWNSSEIEQRCKENSIPGIDDTLENLIVYFVVQLSILLGHESSQLRVDSCVHLIKLASILDPSTNESKLAPIVSLFRSAKSLQQIHALFNILAPKFQCMLIPILSGFECYQNHPDWRIRSACNTALSRILYEQQAEVKEYKTAIYNIYFALTSEENRLFQDRLVMIQALHLLSPIYVKDKKLSNSIVHTLLSLVEKTAGETLEIQSLVAYLFNSLVDPQSDPDFTVFINIINPASDCSYDLLGWSLDLFLRCGYTPPSLKMTKHLPPFKWQNDFAVLLTNYFRAGPAIIRYGAAICLYTIINMSPKFLDENKYLYMYIIAGMLDLDQSTVFLYESMMQIVDCSYSQQMRAALSHVHRGNVVYTYDTLYVDIPEWDYKDNSKSQLLDLISKQSPPVANLLLHKMVNALEYMSISSRIRQLNIIMHLGKSAEKALVPLCQHSDSVLQREAIRVIQALMPGFQNANIADVAFLWSYIHPLLHSNMKSNILKSALELMKTFPLLQLSSIAREELIQSLFRLIFYPDHAVRAAVYKFIAEAGEFWKASGELPRGLSILFQALGDSDVNCVKSIIDYIIILGGPMVIPLGTALSQVRDTASKSMLELIKAFDDLAVSIAMYKSDFRQLVDALCNTDRTDFFWTFYLENVPENQLARPEDYPYYRNYIQAPFWISLLSTKLNVFVPPSDNTQRGQVPLTYIAKRRFICGFMMILFPTMGIAESTMRHASCLTAIRCCFKQTNLQPSMLRGLLEIATQQLLSSKKITFQLSALDILGMIAKMKIPGISESILQEYIDLCIEFLHNTPSAMVKTAVLNFVEILMMVFPKGISNKLDEIRDISRLLLVDADKEVVIAASRVFLLVFRFTQSANSEEAEKYLNNELDQLNRRGTALTLGDPLYKDLIADQVELLIVTCILASGQLRDSVVSGYEKAQQMFKYLKYPNFVYRTTALSAILSLIPSMDTVYGTVVLWILLPLYADPCPAVRTIFCNFQKNVPDMIERHCQLIQPHSEDNNILPGSSWTDILVEGAAISISPKQLVDLHAESLQDSKFSVKFFPEDERYHFPRISQKLLNRFKAIADTLSLSLPAQIQEQVIYHLHFIKEFKPLTASAILVLSIFLRQNEDLIAANLDPFITLLNQEIKSDNREVIEAGLLALHTIGASDSSLGQIVDKLMSIPHPNHGDMYAFLYLFPCIKDRASSNGPEIVKKYLPIINNQKYLIKARILALSVCLKYLPIGTDEHVKSCFDASQELLNNVDDSSLRSKIYKFLGDALQSIKDVSDLQIVKQLVSDARRDAKSKSSSVRRTALDVFCSLSSQLSLEEKLWFIFRFLVDPDSKIKKQIKTELIRLKMIDLELLGENFKANPPFDQALEHGHLPVINQGGMSVVNLPAQTDSITMMNQDPFNYKYMNSDKFQRYVAMYGIPFPDNPPVTIGVLESLDAKVDSTLIESKYENLLNYSPTLLLTRLIELMPRVAMDIVQDIANHTINYITSETEIEAEGFLETAIHNIEIFTSLVIAHKGSGEKFNEWTLLIQTNILRMLENSKTLREQILHEMERTFFFYSYSAQIPLVSDEQALAFEQMNSGIQDATLEILKYGKVEQIVALENNKNELSVELNKSNIKLTEKTTMSLHLLSGLGIACSTNQNISIEQMEQLVSFYISLIENDHRNIRQAAIEALILLTNLQLERLQKDARERYLVQLQQISKDLLGKLENDRMFRKRLEYLQLLRQFIPYIQDAQLRSNTVSLIIELWTDPDSMVRQESIKTIKVLSEQGIKEIFDTFATQIMPKLAKLLNNPDYLQKEALNELLEWRFSMPNNW